METRCRPFWTGLVLATALSGLLWAVLLLIVL
jgi:hypothetical protein